MYSEDMTDWQEYEKVIHNREHWGTDSPLDKSYVDTINASVNKWQVSKNVILVSFNCQLDTTRSRLKSILQLAAFRQHIVSSEAGFEAFISVFIDVTCR
ncbi:hypothetical protein STEG23_018510, partial [Scotinomys teguina]